MRFDTNSATPVITFKPVRVLETHEHQVVIEQGKTLEAKNAITMTVAEADGIKLPKLEAPVEAPKAKEPKAEAKVEDVEPVKRSAKKEEEPAPKKDLSKILEEWDD